MKSFTKPSNKLKLNRGAPLAKTFFFFKKSNPTKKCNYEMFFGFTKLGPRVFGAKAKDTAISLGEI